MCLWPAKTLASEGITEDLPEAEKSIKVEKLRIKNAKQKANWPAKQHFERELIRSFYAMWASEAKSDSSVERLALRQHGALISVECMAWPVPFGCTTKEAKLLTTEKLQTAAINITFEFKVLRHLKRMVLAQKDMRYVSQDANRLKRLGCRWKR